MLDFFRFSYFLTAAELRTDCLCDWLFCIAVGTAVALCGSRSAMPDGVLLFWRQSTASLVFRVGASAFRGFTLRSFSFSHSSPSLIGLLAPVRCMLTGSVFWMRKNNTVTPAVHARVRAHTLTHTLRVVNQCLEFHTHTHTRARARGTHARITTETEKCRPARKRC